MSDYDYISLRFQDQEFSLLSEGDEPWTRFKFDILAWDHKSETKVRVGTMEASKLNIGIVFRQNWTLFDAFDAFSSETTECYSAVFDDDGNIRKSLIDESCGQLDCLVNDFHLLQRIEIDEKCKGHGIAGTATQIYLENFANSSDVVCFKAFPLQHECSLDGKPYKRPFGGSMKTCQAKLCKYYEKLGFRRIQRTPFFFFVVEAFLDKRHEMENRSNESMSDWQNGKTARGVPTI